MSHAVSSPLYAAIDLGSNSFHMLIVRPIDGQVQTMAKIKRKVRLANGLDKQNNLSHDAMERGWDCLRLFAERLQDIPAQNIQIVGTAALRSAVNSDAFLAKANQILGHPIQIISGEQEAATIYKGVAHTSGGLGRRLVVDIGGASTELIIGEGFEPNALVSLPMGCVTWLDNYFNDRELSQYNFDQAINAAKEVLEPILKRYFSIGWQLCVGASGTVQALQEIMLAQGMDEEITLAKLKRLQKQAMAASHLEELEIEGLTLERALVFPSGLSILIAIFESLDVQSMTLAGGALREGLAYGMIDAMQHTDIRQRTIDSLQARYQLDVDYAKQAEHACQLLLEQCGGQEWIGEPQAQWLLSSAALLHEIGLSIDYKKGGEHGAYLLSHIDLPGFTRAQRHLLAELIRRYREQLTSMPEQHAVSGKSSKRLLRLLRIAVILTHRRSPKHQPKFDLSANDESLTLTLDKTWLNQNPLTWAELEIEANRQTDIGWPLTLNLSE